VPARLSLRILSPDTTRTWGTGIGHPARAGRSRKSGGCLHPGGPRADLALHRPMSPPPPPPHTHKHAPRAKSKALLPARHRIQNTPWYKRPYNALIQQAFHMTHYGTQALSSMQNAGLLTDPGRRNPRGSLLLPFSPQRTTIAGGGEWFYPLVFGSFVMESVLAFFRGFLFFYLSAPCHWPLGFI